jgi:tetratricopeptide (TPR) repeat protein
LLATATLTFAQSAGPDLPRAEQLIRDGQAAQAYDLLLPFQAAQLGREDYDYLLGLAALESGRPAVATLAFERVLASNPNYAAAHLDMGRAYFLLADDDGARAEFEAILRSSPPPAARATAERYLAALADRARQRQVQRSAYLEAGFGRDTNINYATSAGTLFVPLFGVNLTLAPSSTRRADNFLSYGGGAEISIPVGIDGQWRALAGIDVRKRGYRSAEEFDYLTTDYRVGAQYSAGAHLLRFALGHGDYDLDGSPLRRVESLSADWRIRLDERTEISPYGQQSRIRYVQATSQVNSANMLLYGITVAREIGNARSRVLFGGVFQGSETATDGRTDGDRDLYGVRLGLQGVLRDGLDGFIQASYQKSNYEQLNSAFQIKRQDRQSDLTIGVNWQFDRSWSLAPKASYTLNHSHVPLNDYSRLEMSVFLRRTF